MKERKRKKKKKKNTMKQLAMEWATVGWDLVGNKRDRIRRGNITIKISKQIANRVITRVGVRGNIDFFSSALDLEIK